MHARSTDTGKHHSVCGGDETVVDGETSIRTATLQCLLGRPEIADSVIEHGNQRLVAHRDYSTPFVDGIWTPSMRTASRRHRANPLNTASMM